MEIVGLIIAILALVISVLGIWDVREKVRLLLTVERNRAFTKTLNEIVLNFIEPIDDSSFRWANMHEFCMLQNSLDRKRTTESSQTMVNNEALQTAAELVRMGMAIWKPNMDAEKAKEVVAEWQTAKNTARLNNILGRQKDSLF